MIYEQGRARGSYLPILIHFIRVTLAGKIHIKKQLQLQAWLTTIKQAPVLNKSRVGLGTQGEF